MQAKLESTQSQLSFDFWTASPKSLGAMANAMLTSFSTGSGAAVCKPSGTPERDRSTPSQDCRHVGCVRTATMTVRNRPYCENHGTLRQEIDAARAAKADETTNATLLGGPNCSDRRVIYLGESEVIGYCRIQFPGDTYSTGEPRIQTVNSGVIVRDSQ
jgi:hypothetical protein